MKREKARFRIAVKAVRVTMKIEVGEKEITIGVYVGRVGGGREEKTAAMYLATTLASMSSIKEARPPRPCQGGDREGWKGATHSSEALPMHLPAHHRFTRLHHQNKS